MKRRTTLPILFAAMLGLAVLLSACGGGVPTKPLTQAAATQVATTGMLGDQMVANMIAPGGYSPLGMGLKALGLQGIVPQASCSVTTSPTTPVDNDGDGWYATSTATYNCTQAYGSSGGTITISGSMTEQDKNDNDPTSGTKATIKDLTIKTDDGAGNVSSIVYNLSWDLTKQSSTNYALAFDVKLQLDDSSSGTVVFEVKGNPTYTGDSAADPFAAGTFTFDGSVVYQDSNARYELTRKSTGVHYSDSCSSVFDSGTVNYADNQGDTMKITYNGCGSETITYNGSPI